MALMRMFEVCLRSDPETTGIAIGETTLHDKAGKATPGFWVVWTSKEADAPGDTVSPHPWMTVLSIDQFPEMNGPEIDEDLLDALKVAKDNLKTDTPAEIVAAIDSAIANAEGALEETEEEEEQEEEETETAEE